MVNPPWQLHRKAVLFATFIAVNKRSGFLKRTLGAGWTFNIRRCVYFCLICFYCILLCSCLCHVGLVSPSSCTCTPLKRVGQKVWRVYFQLSYCCLLIHMHCLLIVFFLDHLPLFMIKRPRCHNYPHRHHHRQTITVGFKYCHSVGAGIWYEWQCPFPPWEDELTHSKCQAWYLGNTTLYNFPKCTRGFLFLS